MFALSAILQGEHRRTAEQLVEKGNFDDAIREYHKELETWYLRMSFNYHEAPSLYGIAQCRSQLEEFEKARQTYTAITSKFQGFYKNLAEEELRDLDQNLAIAAKLEDALSMEQDDREKVPLLFELALAYRSLNCHRKAIESYEEIESLEVPEGFKTQAREFAEDL
jgi:tetratricopeptide (TPR) repeat protein